MALTQKPSKLSGSRPRSQRIDYRSLVAEVEGEDYPFFVHDAYEFSRRLFREDDNAGNYNKPFPPEAE